MATKNMAYDSAAYLARASHSFGAVTAGASAVTSKFIAFTNLNIFSVTAAAAATGTSTYGPLWNGTATVTTAVGAQTFSVIRIMNNAAAGATPSLTTATYGPFVMSLYDGTSTNTQTNSSKPGFANNVALFGTGTTGQLQAGSPSAAGGFTVNQGDQIYVVQGTDATAVGAYTIEYGITPLANVTN